MGPNVEIQSQVVGTVYNGILDTVPVVPVNQLAFVASIAATSVTAGGIDPETITAYLDRLSNLLEIATPDPVLPNDFAILAQSATDSSGNLLGVFRALAINLLNPGRTITGTVTLATTTALVDTAGSFTPDDVGRTVTGTDIPSSTTISAYVSATQVIMSNAATGSETLGTVTLGDLTDAEGCLTVAAMDGEGNALTSYVAGELAAFLETFREEGFNVSVIGPTVTTVDVACSFYASPNYIGPPTPHDAVQAVITEYLATPLFAGGDLIPPWWDPTQNYVRIAAMVALISQTPGVAYVDSLTLNGGTSDIALSGYAPVPTAGTVTVTVLS